MPHFFVRTEDIQGSTITLTGDNAHHASYALRLAVGDHVTVCDQIQTYHCVLAGFDGDIVTAEILSTAAADSEPPYEAILYQALPKGDKLDTIIQKAVECGVTEIVPFVSSRCIAQMKPEAEPRKTQRRNRIAEEAAKQSGRGRIPLVRSTESRFQEVLAEASTCDLALFCYEEEQALSLRTRLAQWQCSVDDTPRTLPEDGNGLRRPRIALMIGSEGGFSPEEAAQARSMGLSVIGLGRRILRTETAASFVLSCLSFQYEL